MRDFSLLSWEYRCKRCFSLLEKNHTSICKKMSSSKLSSLFSVFQDSPVIRSFLSAFVHRGAYFLLSTASHYLSLQYAQSSWPVGDLLVPLPCHQLYRWKRGYLASTLLAKEWGKQLSVPICSALKRRFVSSHLENTSSVSPSLYGRTVQEKVVFLIADLCTREELAASARVLQMMGAKSVYGCTLCLLDYRI